MSGTVKFHSYIAEARPAHRRIIEGGPSRRLSSVGRKTITTQNNHKFDLCEVRAHVLAPSEEKIRRPKACIRRARQRQPKKGGIHPVHSEALDYVSSLLRHRNRGAGHGLSAC